MAAAAPKPSFPGQANASGIVPGTPGGIDYKNTSTIRLTRSSLFSGGTAGKPPTPFGSGLIPALPPSGSAAPKPTAPASRPPVPTPVPPATPAPVTPPPPAPAPATPAGKRGGAAARPETGKIPAMKQAGKGASPLLLGKAMAAGVPMESGETLVAVKELSGNSELPWMNLMLALAPVLMIPVFVVLAPSIGTGLSAGIGTIVGLACWLGIIYRHMTAPHGKICMVVTDKRSVLAAPDSKQETRF